MEESADKESPGVPLMWWTKILSLEFTKRKHVANAFPETLASRQTNIVVPSLLGKNRSSGINVIKNQLRSHFEVIWDKRWGFEEEPVKKASSSNES